MNDQQFQMRIPEKQIDVIEAGRKPRVDHLAFELGRDVRFSTAALESYAFARWEAVTHDLMVVAASIEYADKVVKRHPSGWARRIAIRIPVHDPSRWNATPVRNALHEAIEFLTGDCWDISFAKRARISCGPAAATLDLGVPVEAVLPFSDGMDSRAVAGIEGAKLGSKLVLVRVGTKTSDKPRKDGTPVPFTSVPYDVVSNMPHRETSARTRGFKFAVISSIAAYLTDAFRVLVPESGQGAIGPAILRVGHAHPDYRNHPLFARRMERFLNALLGSDIRFEFPRLWNTKGETLAAYAALDDSGAWQTTRSCWRGNQWSSVGGKRRQCGVCAACMLRRVSVHAAGLKEAADTYLCPDLGAPTLEESTDPNFRQITKAFREYAIAGVLHMDHMADLSLPDARVQLRIHATFLGPALDLSVAETEELLAKLFAKHAREWKDFTESIGERSFIRQLVQVRR